MITNQSNNNPICQHYFVLVKHEHVYFQLVYDRFDLDEVGLMLKVDLSSLSCQHWAFGSGLEHEAHMCCAYLRFVVQGFPH